MTWEPSDMLVEKTARAMLSNPDDWYNDAPHLRIPLKRTIHAALIAARDDMVAEAVKAEAEACAKVADEFGGWSVAAAAAATAIRARHP